MGWSPFLNWLARLPNDAVVCISLGAMLAELFIRHEPSIIRWLLLTAGALIGRAVVIARQ